MIKKILFYLHPLVGLKRVLTYYFSFLDKKFKFTRTKDSKLVIPSWERFGIGFTNGIHVIVIVDDIREKRLVSIVYKIRRDFKIPINTSNYFTLEEYLIKNGMNQERAHEYVDYGKYGLKKVIENIANYLEDNYSEIFPASKR